MVINFPESSKFSDSLIFADDIVIPVKPIGEDYFTILHEHGSKMAVEILTN